MIHRKKNDLLEPLAGRGRNRLKIPLGLSTIKYRRWSEFPSGGGVHGNSPHEKKNKKPDLFQKDATYMYLSEPLEGRGRKQAQDPPGSLHTQVSSVE